MSWSTPRTWAVGETLTAAHMNTYISNDLSALRINYATSFPGSPSDGDLAVIVDSTSAPTYHWQFRYNASEATYKWEFIGGTPAVVSVTTDESPSASGSWVNLATDGPTVTLPAGIGGNFYCLGYASAANSSGGIQGGEIGVALGNTTPALVTANNFFVTSRTTCVVQGIITGASAGGTIKLRYLNSSTTSMSWGWRSLSVWPVICG